MYNPAEIPNNELHSYITQADWVGLSQALKKRYVRITDIIVYSKDMLDRCYTSQDPHTMSGKTLFQVLICAISSGYKSENHYRLLEGLILSESITHSKELAITAIFMPRGPQDAAAIACTNMLLSLYDDAGPGPLYDTLIRNLRRDQKKINFYAQHNQWKALLTYTEKNLMGLEFFIHFSIPCVTNCINQLQKELAGQISDKQKQYFIFLMAEFNLLLRRNEEKEKAKTYEYRKSLFIKCLTSRTIWVTLVSLSACAFYYQRLQRSHHTIHTQHQLINDSGKSFTIQHDDGSVSSLHAGSSMKLENTDKIITVTDPDSSNHLRITLSRYQGTLDEYYLTITIRQARWYERFLYRTPLTYSISWHPKESDEALDQT